MKPNPLTRRPAILLIAPIVGLVVLVAVLRFRGIVFSGDVAAGAALSIAMASLYAIIFGHVLAWLIAPDPEPVDPTLFLDYEDDLDREPAHPPYKPVPRWIAPLHALYVALCALVVVQVTPESAVQSDHFVSGAFSVCLGGFFAYELATRLAYPILDKNAPDSSEIVSSAP